MTHRFGTKGRLNDAAVRSRESMQIARAIINVDADLNLAIDVARRAAAEASEFEQAVEAYAAEQGARKLFESEVSGA